MVQANDTTSGKKHVPNLQEIDAVITRGLSELDQQQFGYVREQRENYIDYHISSVGNYLCTYRAQSGFPGWSVNYSDDPHLRHDGSLVAYLIKAYLEQEFGKAPWLAEDKYPYIVFFHQVLPTTVDHVFGILERFRVERVIQDTAPNPGPFYDLVIEKSPYDKNSVQFTFNVLRHRGFGLVGRVDVMPINADNAEVKISNYRLTNHIINNAVEIHLAGNELLTDLANRLCGLFKVATAIDQSLEISDQNQGRVQDARRRVNSTKNIREGSKAQHMQNRQRLFIELITQKPELTQSALAEYATDEAYDRICEILQDEHPNWSMNDIQKKASYEVMNRYGKNRFTIPDVKYAFRNGQWEKVKSKI